MIIRIARKEFTEMIRDGRFRWVAATVFMLLTAALLAGWQHYRRVEGQRAAAQERERANWLNKEGLIPHWAAHFGLFVFRPASPVAAVDNGLTSYLGVSLRLEAHKQNLAQLRPAEDATAVQRFGELTAAATLQVLVPLLIIALTFASFAGEREQGTLRQLLSLGIPKRDLALGKALGIIGPLLLLLLPAVIIGVLALALTSGLPLVVESVPRLALLALFYLIYFASFVGIALTVSAQAASARLSLTILLSFWFLTCLVAPRVATDLAKWRHPAPTALQFLVAIEKEKREMAERLPFDQRQKQVRERLMRQYSVTRLEDLPENPYGVALTEGEAEDTKLYDKHFNSLYDTYERQNRFTEMGGALAPFLAIQSLSMGVAGTDFAQHRHFAEAAEQYRRVLVQTMNDAERYQRKAGAWDFNFVGDRQLWERVPPFTYDRPNLVWALRNHTLSLALLFGWFVVVVTLTQLAVARVRIF
jgi:ABC-2 type transport system permease protein